MPLSLIVRLLLVARQRSLYKKTRADSNWRVVFLFRVYSLWNAVSLSSLRFSRPLLDQLYQNSFSQNYLRSGFSAYCTWKCRKRGEAGPCASHRGRTRWIRFLVAWYVRWHRCDALRSYQMRYFERFGWLLWVRVPRG